MKKIITLIAIMFSLVLFTNCEEDDTTPAITKIDYVAFGNSSYSTGVDPGGSTTFDIPVYASIISSSDRSYNVSVDDSSTAADGSYTLPSSVTIPSGTNEGTLTVSLSDTNLGIGINSLVINFEGAKGIFNGGNTTLDYIQNCNEVTGTLDLTFDRWGSEVSWNIKDALGGVVASGGGYSDTGSGTTTSDSIDITLCVGRSYTLTTTDGFGDGWGAPGNYTLTIGGVVKVTGNGSLMNNGGTGAISATAPFNTN